MREQREHVCMHRTEDCGNQHPGNGGNREQNGTGPWQPCTLSFKVKGTLDNMSHCEESKECELTIQELTNFFPRIYGSLHLPPLYPISEWQTVLEASWKPQRLKNILSRYNLKGCPSPPVCSTMHTFYVNN